MANPIEEWIHRSAITFPFFMSIIQTLGWYWCNSLMLYFIYRNGIPNGDMDLGPIALSFLILWVWSASVSFIGSKLLISRPSLAGFLIPSILGPIVSFVITLHISGHLSRNLMPILEEALKILRLGIFPVGVSGWDLFEAVFFLTVLILSFVGFSFTAIRFKNTEIV